VTGSPRYCPPTEFVLEAANAKFSVANFALSNESLGCLFCFSLRKWDTTSSIFEIEKGKYEKNLNNPDDSGLYCNHRMSSLWASLSTRPSKKRQLLNLHLKNSKKSPFMNGLFLSNDV
jgi:hypothetical protein